MTATISSMVGGSAGGPGPLWGGGGAGRVGGIGTAFVARRATGVEAGHRRRRSATAGGIEQHRGHDKLLMTRGAGRGPSLAWKAIATATLLPFHRCRSEAGAHRALVDAWS